MKTLGDVHTMYMTCAFETAWNKRRRSPWCSPFTLDDFKVMEYAEDLKYFWVDGYGHELTYKQACPAFNDMMELFQKYIIPIFIFMYQKNDYFIVVKKNFQNLCSILHILVHY